MRTGRGSSWLSVALVLALAAGIVTALARHVLARPQPALQGQVVFPERSRSAPELALTDQLGRVVTVRSLRGRALVITFLDSHCTKDCPIIGRELALVERQLGPSTPWTLLVVSVAPSTDSPASSASFALESGWHGDWRWLFGTPAQLAKVWSAYGIWVHPTPTDIMHTAALYLVDPEGYMRVADLLPFAPDQLTRSIRSLTAPAGTGWLGWF